MQVLNVKFHEVDWDHYCTLPGKSFSWLKNEGTVIPESEGIRIGKLTHTYVLKPKEYNYEQADIVIPIARELVRFFPPLLLNRMTSEMGVTAIFETEGLAMDWRGMIDLHLYGQLVVDFKIIAGDLKHYIETFKYDHQIIGYGLPVRAPYRLIIAFNKKTKRIQTHQVQLDLRWWQYKVKQYGKPYSIP